MKQRFFNIVLSLLLGVFCCGSAWAAAPAERIYRLAMVGVYPDNHPVVNEVIVPWLMELAEKTNNRLVITYYSPNILLPENTHFEALRKRNVPIAMQSVPMSQGNLPLSSLLCVPGGLSSSRSGTSAFWRMYRNTPEIRKEYEEFKILSLHSSPPVQLHLNFQLKDLSELEGKRVICTNSYMAAMLRGIHATPVILPESAHYLALTQGKADGVALPFDMVLAYSIEQFPFIQSVCMNINLTPYWIAMNKADWEALPREYQRVMDASIGEALSMNIAEALDTAAAAGQARMAGCGVHIKTLTSIETTSWRAALSPAARELWLENMNAGKFPDPGRLLDRAMQFYRESEAAFAPSAQ